MVMIDVYLLGLGADFHKKDEEGDNIYDEYGNNAELIDEKDLDKMECRTRAMYLNSHGYNDENIIDLHFGIECENHWKYEKLWRDDKNYDHEKYCECSGLHGLLGTPYEKKRFDLYMQACKKHGKIPVFDVYIRKLFYLEETEERKKGVDNMIVDLWRLFSDLDEEGWVYMVQFTDVTERERIYSLKPYMGKTKSAAKGGYAPPSFSSSSSSST